MKIRPGRTDVLRVMLYVLEVQQRLKRWKEQAQRQVRWFSAADAADAVAQPELASVILRLAELNPSEGLGRLAPT